MKICEEMPFINQCFANLLEVKSEDLKNGIEVIQEAGAIIIAAEGRSERAMRIGLKGIGKRVISTDDLDFLWGNLYTAAPHLERDFGRVVLLVSSSSGETTTPKQRVKEISDYIKESGSEKFKIVAVGSRTDSSVTRRIEEDKSGLFIKLAGPKTGAKTPEEALTFGLMNDIYELSSMVLFQRLKECVNSGEGFEEIFNKIRKEAEEIAESVDNWVGSEQYNLLMQKMSGRGIITFAGVGPAKDAAGMSAIRMNHIKRAFGQEANVAGPFASKPMLGDVLKVISWSGETPIILEWTKDFKRAHAFISAFCGKESSLTGVADQKFVIGSAPHDFYLKSAFLTSVEAVGLIKEYKRQGFPVPPEILRWYHSVTE